MEQVHPTLEQNFSRMVGLWLYDRVKEMHLDSRLYDRVVSLPCLEDRPQDHEGERRGRLGKAIRELNRHPDVTDTDKNIGHDAYLRHLHACTEASIRDCEVRSLTKKHPTNIKTGLLKRSTKKK